MLVTTQWPLKRAAHLTSLVWVCVLWRPWKLNGAVCAMAKYLWTLMLMILSYGWCVQKPLKYQVGIKWILNDKLIWTPNSIYDVSWRVLKSSGTHNQFPNEDRWGYFWYFLGCRNLSLSGPAASGQPPLFWIPWSKIAWLQLISTKPAFDFNVIFLNVITSSGSYDHNNHFLVTYVFPLLCIHCL